MHHRLVKAVLFPISLPALKWLDWNELHLRLALCCLGYICRHDSAKGNKVIMKYQSLLLWAQTPQLQWSLFHKQENQSDFFFGFVLNSPCAAVDAGAVEHTCCWFSSVDVLSLEEKKGGPSLTSVSKQYIHCVILLHQSWHLIYSTSQRKSDFSAVTDHLTALSFRRW